MEIHPDAYDDPEEDNDWVTPSLPDPKAVPDNTDSWWIFYRWRGAPNPAQRRVALAVTREITPPWRRGLGIVTRGKNGASAVGVWTRGKAPHILRDNPVEKDWQETVTRANHLERGLERN
jgi:hypothetical protein